MKTRYINEATMVTPGKAHMFHRVRWSRWRLINTFIGGLLVVLMCTYLLAPGDTLILNDGLAPNNQQQSPPPLNAIYPATSLSKEEEAMFGQYQAVGLGNDTLEETYAPITRKYVSPPNGDIYSTFGVVMASFSPHAKFLSRFFDSMAKFCRDCHLVRIMVIVPSNEVDLFSDLRIKHISKLPGLEMIPFTQVFPALNETLAVNTPGWPDGWMGWTEERLLKDKDRLLLQV
ncbi:hypothetical protein BCR44DRAFT_192719 [Catenaria anguillulae PL171]|uniref:Uncharacterized protein n=1 Tax=Catenaria anguillulae PL171 TaxID=765915 RepID=A0A1Y2HZD4_9FUNG|nr:hypothetical protein BCR44DRAFT_192719 [Catenaria anguillulae PL171]